MDCRAEPGNDEHEGHQGKRMLTNTRKVRIEWGDCDPAGIVFYPRYFEMFEICIATLFERATGMTKYQMLRHYDFAGYPVVEARAKFSSPAKFGDDVMAETTISEFRRSSFDVTHRVFNGDKLAVEGFETRVWVGRDPADPARIKAQPVPAEVLERFTRA
jgi:4-hydroxybenzoyl-CoA thioesterase